MSDDSKREEAREQSPEEAPAPDQRERPLFVHPRWTVGVVLIFGVAAIIAGLRDPVWFLIGAPCILVLIVYIWVRVLGAGRP